MKPKLLLHICCAPCSTHVVEVLREDYNLTGFFYNPNIHPQEEYLLRLEETRKVAQALKVPLIEGSYDNKSWFAITEKHKNEPEKGRRCDICYAVRIQKTAEKASELVFAVFTTVMSLSPWKKADVLNRLGRMFARRYKLHFLEANFKRKDGFKKSVELSRDFGLYRQEYCGCIYSMR